MAKQLEDFDFGTPRSKYPWDEWLDGNIWELVEGEDYVCGTESMYVTFRTKCHSRGLIPRTKRNQHSVIVQALPKTHIVESSSVTGTDRVVREINPEHLRYLEVDGV